MRPHSQPDSPAGPIRPARLLCHAVLLAVLAASSGCIYKVPIQQGNYLNPDQVSQLQVGMTRSQVAFLLGTPMVPNGFDADRWDYYYYIKAGRKWEAQTSRLQVMFKDGKVDQILRDGKLDEPKQPDSPKDLLPDAPRAPPPNNPTEAGPNPVREPAPPSPQPAPQTTPGPITPAPPSE